MQYTMKDMLERVVDAAVEAQAVIAEDAAHVEDVAVVNN